jgi:hypothetical protein
MTRKQLRRATYMVIGIYALAFGIGLTLRISGPPTPTPYYETFKDLIPLILAIPAAYLGYCFQQRGSYLQSLRSLWSQLVIAVNSAIQYTYLESPTQEQFGKILTDLSIATDELRGVYKNIGESSKNVGLYPYEPIKDIHKVISRLGFGNLDEKNRITARRQVVGHWKSIRSNFLDEFDRAVPTKVVSVYIEK